MSAKAITRPAKASRAIPSRANNNGFAAQVLLELIEQNLCGQASICSTIPRRFETAMEEFTFIFDGHAESDRLAWMNTGEASVGNRSLISIVESVPSWAFPSTSVMLRADAPSTRRDGPTGKLGQGERE